MNIILICTLCIVAFMIGYLATGIYGKHYLEPQPKMKYRVRKISGMRNGTKFMPQFKISSITSWEDLTDEFNTLQFFHTFEGAEEICIAYEKERIETNIDIDYIDVEIKG